MLAIVSPMAIELAAIKRSVPDASARDISFGVTGIGKIHTERYIAEIIKRAPEAIVVVGFCGGSDPALAPGDLHVAGSYLNPTTGHFVDPDTDLASELMNAANRVRTPRRLQSFGHCAISRRSRDQSATPRNHWRGVREHGGLLGRLHGTRRWRSFRIGPGRVGQRRLGITQ